MVHPPELADTRSVSPVTVTVAAKVSGTSILLTQLVRITAPTHAAAATAACLSSRIMDSHHRQPRTKQPPNNGMGGRSAFIAELN